jgi:hypothetical protein
VHIKRKNKKEQTDGGGKKAAQDETAEDFSLPNSHSPIPVPSQVKQHQQQGWF